MPCIFKLVVCCLGLIAVLSNPTAAFPKAVLIKVHVFALAVCGCRKLLCALVRLHMVVMGIPFCVALRYQQWRSKTFTPWRTSWRRRRFDPAARREAR